MLAPDTKVGETQYNVEMDNRNTNWRRGNYRQDYTIKYNVSTGNRFVVLSEESVPSTKGTVWFNGPVDELSSLYVHHKCSKIGCLLYVDDLLIISETQHGLQTSLNKLHKYCQTWQLWVNIKKTKVIIFRKRKTCDKYIFKYGTETLVIADKYTYLGLTFNNNGSFSEVVYNLKEKGYKALFQMCSSLYTG